MRRVVTLALLAVSLVGCGRPAAPPIGHALPAPELKDALALREGGDRFAFALKDALLLDNPKRNLCLSPFSLSFALCLLLNGATGQLATNTARVLGFNGLDLDSVNRGNRALTDSLSGGQFHLANSAWMAPGLEPKPSLVRTLKNVYGADIFPNCDFGPATAQAANRWVKERTNGMIDALQDAFPKGTFLYLVNALAFEGDWQTQFDASSTSLARFTLDSGEAVMVRTMHSHAHRQAAFARGYPPNAGTQALYMPYVGGHFGMWIILPPKGVPASTFLSSLTVEQFRDLTKRHDLDVSRVSLPRFTLKTGGLMNGALSRMGLDRHCTAEDLAAFGARDSGNIDVIQRCRIEVDERGTRAAAASGGGATKGVSHHFAADRPFIFALVSAQTGAILFLGLVLDPRG